MWTVADALRIPIAEARCPWCGSKLGGWSLGATAACLRSSWAMLEEDVVSAPTCPVDWRGGVAEQWCEGWFLRLDDPRDVVAWQLRRSLDIAEMQGEQGRDVITRLQVGIILVRAEAARLLQRGDEWNMAALSAQASAASHLATIGVVTAASEYRHRIATVVGAVQSVVGLALAAWWPTDPLALAATVLVVGGCVAMVVGGWPAVRRTWTTDAMRVSKPAPALPTAGVSGGAQHTSADPTDSGEEKE